MKKLLGEKGILWVLSVLVVLALGFSAYTTYRTLTLEPGQQAVISGGTTIAKPTNGIVDVALRDDGYLVARYEDGTSKELGYAVGKQGEQGESIAPTQAQIAFAVAEYCNTDNRCEPKSPSPEQVAIAVSNYCSTRNQCAGPEGKQGETGETGATGATGEDGRNATDEQVMAAVAAYCSDGRCTGPAGEQGIPGTNGKDPVMSCVIREANGVDRQYIAWKYSVEEDSAYRNLYILPVWAQGENCVDLTA